MSLQFIITHKRKQINHFLLHSGGSEGDGSGGGGGGVATQREMWEKACHSVGVVYHSSPLPKLFLKGHLF